jgi:hypothetical protein
MIKKTLLLDTQDSPALLLLTVVLNIKYNTKHCTDDADRGKTK